MTDEETHNEAMASFRAAADPGAGGLRRDNHNTETKDSMAQIARGIEEIKNLCLK